MPYMTYQISVQEAIRNAGRFMAECDCDAVKLEGGREVLDVIKGLIKATIPVVGDLGLTPQSIAMLGGFKAQGRDANTALRIIEDAKMLEEAGICLLLLEAVPPEVGKIITERAKIPVCGIGAGPHVGRGEVLFTLPTGQIYFEMVERISRLFRTSPGPSGPRCRDLSISPPLKEIAHPTDKAAIVVSDTTRS
jgi:3-methyl-2-oxobutanoate hydroxymethyltransferase